MDNFLYAKESYEIVGAAMEVHGQLGCGFTEPVYQEALEYEFQLRGIPYEREKTLKVLYKDKLLNKEYRVDFVCYDKIIVELKALDELLNIHYTQVYNYLKASGLKLGLLMNFGKNSLESKRVPCTIKW